ncbi:MULTISPECIES: Bug family tripartite tricarboxylate transporter substrate binding protein [Cupriavidus]
MKRWILSLSAAMVACWAAPGQSVANASESWPSRPIKWVVPYPPGGTTDMLARIVGTKLSERLGQPVVIENKPGAGGDVGTAYAAKQAADGYTIVMGNIGPIAVNPTLTPDANFSPTRDLAPVTLLAEVPNLLVVNPQLPVKSVKDLIQYAKQQPNPLSYATPGNGTSLHLAGELFASTAGLRMVHVPYRGSGPGLNDTMAGHVPIMFDNMPSALNLVKSGKLRALAITSPVRSPLLPDVPTMTEAGLSNYQITGWFGVLVPIATPKPIVTRLDAEIQAVLKMPEVRAKIGDLGAIISGASQDEFGRFIQQESAKWQKLIRTAHITAQ